MKKTITIVILLFIAELMSAQEPQKTNVGKEPVSARPNVMVKNDSVRTTGSIPAQRKFVILVENEKKSKVIEDTNDRLLSLQETVRSEKQKGLLGELLWTGFTSAFKQKTVNMSSNLISMGLNYFTEALKSDREKWYRKAQQQCYYNQSLSAESKIDDFYALPSTKGAMDPENLKFEGFGCKNYIELMDKPKEGVGVFYVFCKMRRDSVGLRHIVNHSKFYVEIDSLYFNPKYCNLPNDSTGSADNRFNFQKRDNLSLELKVRFYSSWINQAVMISNDQLLGEFNVNVEIDKNKLNKDGLFIYDKNDPDFDDLISVDGDCYIVPRSYTGTTDGISYQPSWGTGQYRIEMEVTEKCSIVDSYYQIRESGNGEAVAFANATPGKKKWDKAKWKVEWKAMNSRRKNDSFFKNAWKCVVTAYKGTGWVATLTDPATTALYSWETKKLDDWIDEIHDKIFDSDEKEETGKSGKSNVTTTTSPTQSQGNSDPSAGPKGLSDKNINPFQSKTGE